ncbi:MAG: hypothetical protein A2504_09470 [Bdellovibrionales bacterium RIFOXYD12_FULL_39_22]|nr:MAG: hypothetical protein A2385_12960 [Bdellovibrionales bacterium RIFOXYB1_FULL_39_21]OFZ40955.1 MAG: hypothetical protein A2485_16470 [Bdellovibrionales bacterium RIFOXYC12_FULL_39_17]OFZ44783.1 MAG: hypothetical protein A2404_09760 [Bdellovibrionales bacterium RIFOXYC1_FULL_39_130]OFZ74248.1 MAG: hypothetical protein A2560_16725 [Bdellovibrionales bacterium RIFOXYD1_FULL_39_84]OFZ92112.1 MAG: hypothetical protein A2504_09470 [Bdellovibrionales bacterium RIFOXYD12_FULL_39_22]HLE12784.1 Ig
MRIIAVIASASLTLLLALSCVPNRPVGSEVSCPPQMEFSSKTRSCEPSTTIIQQVTILEDSSELVELDYYNHYNTVASACSIISVSPSNEELIEVTSCYCSAGICYAMVEGADNAHGNGQFRFSIRDDAGSYDPITVGVTVTSVNDPPIAEDVTLPCDDPENDCGDDLVNVDGELVGYDFRDNDNNLTYQVTAGPSVSLGGVDYGTAGSVTIDSDGDFHYHPSENFFTTAPNNHTSYEVTFSYRVIDSEGARSNLATVTIPITPIDDPPVSDITTTASSATMPEGLAGVVGGFNVTLHYIDPDGDLATGCAITDFAGLTLGGGCICAVGVCTINVSGLDNSDYNNTAQSDYIVNPPYLEYEVVANAITSDNEMAELTNITPVNDPPALDTNDAASVEPLATTSIVNNVFPAVDEITADEDTIFTIKDVPIAAGNLDDYLEYYQDFTIKITSSDQTIVSDEDIKISFNGGAFSSSNETTISSATFMDGYVGLYDITERYIDIQVTPQAEQSTPALSPITLTINIKDDDSDGGVDENESSYNYTLHITNVDDPPTVAFDSEINAGLVSNETNEVVVTGITLGEGGDDGEDGQTLSVQFSSDNEDLLPVSIANIAAYFDIDNDGLADSNEAVTLDPITVDGVIEIGLLGNPGEPAADVSLHRLILKLRPVAGAYGEVNVGVRVSDDGTFDDSTDDPTSYFKLTINPVGARHGGWKNISAVGPKQDRRNNVINKITCDFSQNSCGTTTLTDCSGAKSPLTSPATTAGKKNAIYYDSANNKCFVNTSTDSTGWSEMKYLACNISSSDSEDGVASCAGAYLLSVEGPSYAHSSECSKFVVNAIDANGNPFTPYEDRLLILTDGAAGGDFYSEASCSTALAGDNITIAAFTSSKEFYYEGDSTAISVAEVIAGTPALAASTMTLTTDNSSSGSFIIAGPSTTTPMGCHHYTLNLKNQYDNLTTSYSSINVTITTSDSSGIIYSDDNCQTTDTTFTLTPGLSSLDFYLTDSLPSSIGTISAAITSSNSAYTTFDFTYNTSASPSISCVGDAAPTILARNDKRAGYYYDKTNKACYYSDPSGAWQQYYGTTDITLEWNDFAITGIDSFEGVTISGWNVYRREVGNDYDWEHPLNQEILDVTTLNFVDKTAVDSKVYFYKILPIDSISLLPTQTREVISEVRLTSPPLNMAFIHRWMANKEVCELMGMNTSSASPYKSYLEKNYRCPFSGPGEYKTALGATYESSTDQTYYDLGKDLLVDLVEIGCNYSYAADCSADGCVGAYDPTTAGVIADNNGDVFYNRENGKCYVASGVAAAATTWTEVNSALAAATTIGNYSHLPPLTNVSQTQASALCAARTPASIAGHADSPLSYKLPTRKEQIAYSAWSDDLSDSTIHTNEQGLQLNSSSKCNSSEASGLHDEEEGLFGYDNSDAPNATNLYSLPATANSGIRSIYTGSSQLGEYYLTEACISRYGVQDFIGNVSEWASDQMACFGEISDNTKCHNSGTDSEACNFTCTALTSQTENGALFPAGVLRLDPNNNDLAVTNDDPFFIDYTLNGIQGPCKDANNDGVCDQYLSSWTLDTRPNFAERFIFPMGLPMNLTYPTDYGWSKLAANDGNSFLYLPLISSNINKLHDDVISVNAEVVSQATNGVGGIVSGGSYKSYAGAGRYHLELVPGSDTVGVAATLELPRRRSYTLDSGASADPVANTTFATIVENNPESAYTIIWALDAAVDDDSVSIATAGTVITVTINDTPTGLTYSGLIEQLNNNAAFSTHFYALTPQAVISSLGDDLYNDLSNIPPELSGPVTDYDSASYVATGPAVYELLLTANTAGSAGNNIMLELVAGGTAGNEVVSISSNTISILIEEGVSTNYDIYQAIINDTIANALVSATDDASPPVIPPAPPAATNPLFAIPPTNLSGGIDPAYNRRPDIGFRCLIEIDSTHYSADSIHDSGINHYNYSPD